MGKHAKSKCRLMDKNIRLRFKRGRLETMDVRAKEASRRFPTRE